MTDEEVETIKRNERINVILNIIGRIIGVGETNFDRCSLKNLDFLDELLFVLLENLEDNVTYNGHEGSRLDLKEKSVRIFRSLNDFIEDILTDFEESENSETDDI